MEKNILNPPPKHPNIQQMDAFIFWTPIPQQNRTIYIYPYHWILHCDFILISSVMDWFYNMNRHHNVGLPSSKTTSTSPFQSSGPPALTGWHQLCWPTFSPYCEVREIQETPNPFSLSSYFFSAAGKPAYPPVMALWWVHLSHKPTPAWEGKEWNDRWDMRNGV